MMNNLKNAIFATAVTAILAVPIFGLNLVRQGMNTVIETDWTVIMWGCLAVFLVQMVRPFLLKKTGLNKVKLPQWPTLSPRTINFIILFFLLCTIYTNLIEISIILLYNVRCIASN